MLKIKQDLKNGSCNFCKRGKVNKDGDGLEYPYKTVTEVTGDFNSGISVRFCDDCLDALAKGNLKYLCSEMECRESGCSFPDCLEDESRIQYDKEQES